MLNILDYYNVCPIAGALNVWPHQLRERPDLVESMLAHREGRDTRFSARKLEVIELSPAEGTKFFNENHLSGTASSSHRYALSYNGEPLIAISIGTPRYTSSFSLEIIRLASKRGVTVVGGASKLISHIRKVHANASILSYSDLLLGEGAVYRAAGFQLLGDTRPGYFWVKGDAVLPRYRTQKHKLIKILGSDIDLSLSETELMQQHGWTKVKDLGHLRWGLAGVDTQQREKRFNFIYKVTRPSIDGAYYFGAHSTDDMDDGYLGSGQLISASIEKYGRAAHRREVLQFFDTRKDLMDAEAALINVSVLADPNCLNLSLGGGSPLLPIGPTTGKRNIWHDNGQERRVEEADLPIYISHGWKIGRHPKNKINLHGKWYIDADGKQGRTTGELPAGSRPGKEGSTNNYRWVQRQGKQTLTSVILPGDEIGFKLSKTNKGKTVVVKDGVQRVVTPAEAEQLLSEGWTRRNSPTTGKIGMRSPTGEKRLVDPATARQLAALGWTIAAKQLKSAPPQVLVLAAELGLRIPKKRKQCLSG